MVLIVNTMIISLFKTMSLSITTLNHQLSTPMEWMDAALTVCRAAVMSHDILINRVLIAVPI